MAATKVNHEWVRDQSPEVQKMVRAIRRRLSIDELREITGHGADTGWSGFTYYTDTVKFYNRHEDAIWQLLSDDADSLGYKSVPALIADFRRAGHADGSIGFKNLLAWYALETVASRLTDW